MYGNFHAVLLIVIGIIHACNGEKVPLQQTGSVTTESSVVTPPSSSSSSSLRISLPSKGLNFTNTSTTSSTYSSSSPVSLLLSSTSGQFSQSWVHSTRGESSAGASSHRTVSSTPTSSRLGYGTGTGSRQRAQPTEQAPPAQSSVPPHVSSQPRESRKSSSWSVNGTATVKSSGPTLVNTGQHPSITNGTTSIRNATATRNATTSNARSCPSDIRWENAANWTSTDTAKLIPTPGASGCCGQCFIESPNVDVYYWPEPNANTDCLATIGNTVDPPQEGATTTCYTVGGVGCVTYWGLDLCCGAGTEISSHIIRTLATWTTINGIAFKNPLYNPWVTSSNWNGLTYAGSMPSSSPITSPPAVPSSGTGIALPVRPRAIEPRGLFNLSSHANESEHGSIAVMDGFTFTSPSIYVNFFKLSATDACGYLGPQVKSTIVAFAPGELSTVAGPVPGPVRDFIIEPGQPLAVPTTPVSLYNFADLPCPPQSVMSEHWWKPEKGQPYRPLIAFPEKIRTIDPLWANCNAELFIGLDPPKYLDPAKSALAPEITPVPAAESQVPAQPGQSVTYIFGQTTTRDALVPTTQTNLGAPTHVPTYRVFPAKHPDFKHPGSRLAQDSNSQPQSKASAGGSGDTSSNQEPAADPSSIPQQQSKQNAEGGSSSSSSSSGGGGTSSNQEPAKDPSSNSDTTNAAHPQQQSKQDAGGGSSSSSSSSSGGGGTSSNQEPPTDSSSNLGSANAANPQQQSNQDSAGGSSGGSDGGGSPAPNGKDNPGDKVPSSNPGIFPQEQAQPGPDGDTGDTSHPVIYTNKQSQAVDSLKDSFTKLNVPAIPANALSSIQQQYAPVVTAGPVGAPNAKTPGSDGSGPGQTRPGAPDAGNPDSSSPSVGSPGVGSPGSVKPAPGVPGSGQTGSSNHGADAPGSNPPGSQAIDAYSPGPGGSPANPSGNLGAAILNQEASYIRTAPVSGNPSHASAIANVLSSLGGALESSAPIGANNPPAVTSAPNSPSNANLPAQIIPPAQVQSLQSLVNEAGQPRANGAAALPASQVQALSSAIANAAGVPVNGNAPGSPGAVPEAGIVVPTPLPHSAAVLLSSIVAAAGEPQAAVNGAPVLSATAASTLYGALKTLEMPAPAAPTSNNQNPNSPADSPIVPGGAGQAYAQAQATEQAQAISSAISAAHLPPKEASALQSAISSVTAAAAAPHPGITSSPPLSPAEEIQRISSAMSAQGYTSLPPAILPVLSSVLSSPSSSLPFSLGASADGCTDCPTSEQQQRQQRQRMHEIIQHAVAAGTITPDEAQTLEQIADAAVGVDEAGVAMPAATGAEGAVVAGQGGGNTTVFGGGNYSNNTTAAVNVSSSSTGAVSREDSSTLLPSSPTSPSDSPAPNAVGTAGPSSARASSGAAAAVVFLPTSLPPSCEGWTWLRKMLFSSPAFLSLVPVLALL